MVWWELVFATVKWWFPKVISAPITWPYKDSRVWTSAWRNGDNQNRRVCWWRNWSAQSQNNWDHWEAHRERGTSLPLSGLGPPLHAPHISLELTIFFVHFGLLASLFFVIMFYSGITENVTNIFLCRETSENYKNIWHYVICMVLFQTNFFSYQIYVYVLQYRKYHCWCMMVVVKLILMSACIFSFRFWHVNFGVFEWVSVNNARLWAWEVLF